MSTMINTPEHAINISDYVVCTTIHEGEYYITGNKQFEDKMVYKITPEQFEQTTDGDVALIEVMLKKLNAPEHLAIVAVISFKHKQSMFGFSADANPLETLVIDGYNVSQLEYPMNINEIPPSKIISDIRANPMGKERKVVH
jgi:hypothetical protein